jgi:hypothetical protein
MSTIEARIAASVRRQVTAENDVEDLLDVLHQRGIEFDAEAVYAALDEQDESLGLSEAQVAYFDTVTVTDWSAPPPEGLFGEESTVTVMTEDKRTGPSWREFVNDADEVVEEVGAPVADAPLAEAVEEIASADDDTGIITVWTGMGLSPAMLAQLDR